MAPPYTPDQLLARLDELGIQVTTAEHEAVFTVEQAKAHREGMRGVFTKNLFVRNKKGVMWLLVLQEDRKVDLKELGKQIGAGRISFGSAERLLRTLGVVPGAVSPFGLINDVDHQVRLVLERALLEGETLHFHPLDNTKTTAISPAGFQKFLRSTGHEPQLI